MDDFSEQIRADPEYVREPPWREVECLGNEAIVKVRATDALLATINAAPGFQRIPARFLNLSQTLGDLTAGERTTINNKILSLGYTQAEIDAVIGATLGAWRNRTLRQVFQFVLSRRNTPRYDQPSDTIMLDGPVRPCNPIELTDVV